MSGISLFRQIILVSAIASASACSHFHTASDNNGKPAAEAQKGKTHQPVSVFEHNKLTVAARSDYLAGAGCNAKGVIHVVDVNPCPLCDGERLPMKDSPTMKTASELSQKEQKEPASKEPEAKGKNGDGDGNKDEKKAGQADLSVYNLQRWERYCSGGKLLTHSDWKFLMKQGLDNVPAPLASNCTPPPFSYDQYLLAWKHYCSAKKVVLNDQEKAILKTTQVRPKDVVGNCLGKP